MREGIAERSQSDFFRNRRRHFLTLETPISLALTESCRICRASRRLRTSRIRETRRQRSGRRLAMLKFVQTGAAAFRLDLGSTIAREIR
jgi:hypothetical protein